MFTSFNKDSFRITMLYVGVASLWILFSDSLLNLIVKDVNLILTVSIVKGWFFIALTGMMLYYLIQQQNENYETKNQELEQSNFELVAAYEELIALEEELRYQLTSLEKNQELLRQNEELLIINNNYLNALVGTTLVVVKRMDMTSLVQTIIERAASLADSSHGFIFLVDPTGQYLELKAGSGIHKEHIGIVLKRGEGLSGKVLEMGHSMMIDNYGAWAGKVTAADFSSLGAMVGVPVYSEGKIVAVLGLAYLREHGKIFTKEKLTILEQFANVAALSLDNARLYDSLQLELENQKQQQEKISYLAYHEPITGLYNRNFIKEKFGELLALSNKTVVLMLDLDGFKIVNDIAGHDAGDNLLNIMAQRLRNIENLCTVGSMGLDKFVIIYQPPNDREGYIGKIAKGVLKACQEPFRVNDYDFSLTGSVGIAVYPDHGQDIGILMKNAHIAMAWAKAKKENSYHLYTAELSQEV